MNVIPATFSMRSRILLMMGFLALAVALHYYLVWQPRVERAQRELLMENSVDQMETAALALTSYLVQGQIAAVYEVLDNVKATHGEWLYVDLMESSGVKLYPLTSTPVPIGEDIQLFEKEIMVRGQPIATLRIALDYGPGLEGLRSSLKDIGWVLLTGSFLLIGGVTLLLDRGVRSPISEVSEAARALAVGDYDAVLPEAKNQEVADLVQGFTRMREEISKKHRELSVARDVAESVSEAKSNFIATMSHEMRTPLNTILGLLDLLSETRLEPDQKQYVTSMESSGEMLLSLINDVLDVAKLEANQAEFVSEVFNLGELLETIMQVNGARAESRGIALTLTVPEELRCEWNGDANRIRQILLNLVGNALKFTEKGEIIVEVVNSGASNTKTLICFRIRDTGIGIPPEHRENIFRSFQQVDASISRRYGGTGLGLQICQSLANLMNGRVWLEWSEVGLGSEFRFELPLEKESAQDEQHGRPVEPVSKSRIVPARVLVVEDSEDLGRITKMTLERAGHSVRLVNNGKWAVTEAATGEFDLIFMDVEMPEKDGISATREIRQFEKKRNRSPAPILALTAHAVDRIRRRCLDAGMQEFISKPVRKDQLLRTVDKWVAGLRPAVLVVDDDCDNLQLLRGLVDRDQRLRACWAESGQRALDMLQRVEFAGLLLDVDMPEVNGFDVAQIAREQFGDAMPIIATSGHVTADFRARCTVAGFTDVLTKPISGEQLKVLLSSMASGLEERIQGRRVEVGYS